MMTTKTKHKKLNGSNKQPDGDLGYCIVEQCRSRHHEEVSLFHSPLQVLMEADFWCTPTVCARLWDLLEPEQRRMPSNHKQHHLLWVHMFLCTYKYESELTRYSGGLDGTVDGKTFCKWAWLFIEAISLLECKVIVWENQHANDILNDALVSVDGTDTTIPNIKPFWKGWYSHKHAGPGTRWEVGLCIWNNSIISIHQPFPFCHVGNGMI